MHTQFPQNRARNRPFRQKSQKYKFRLSLIIGIFRIIFMQYDRIKPTKSMYKYPFCL